MCFYPMFFEVFGEIFSSSPSLKCSAFGWEETLASLHNFDVRSGRLFHIFQKQTSPKPLLNYHIPTISVGFYIQMILLELRLLIPLDPALCLVNLVGSGNISVPFVIHLCKFLLELHWSFPSKRVFLRSDRFVGTFFSAKETTLLDFSLMSVLVAMRKILGGAESCGMVNCGNLRLYQQTTRRNQLLWFYDHVDSIIDGPDMSRCTPLSLLQKAVSGRDGWYLSPWLAFQDYWPLMWLPDVRDSSPCKNNVNEIFSNPRCQFSLNFPQFPIQIKGLAQRFLAKKHVFCWLFSTREVTNFGGGKRCFSVKFKVQIFTWYINHYISHLLPVTLFLIGKVGANTRNTSRSFFLWFASITLIWVQHFPEVWFRLYTIVVDVVVSWLTDIVLNVGRDDSHVEDPEFSSHWSAGYTTVPSTLAWGVVADGHSLFDSCLYTSGRCFHKKADMSSVNFPLSAANKQVKHDLILWENWQKLKV